MSIRAEAARKSLVDICSRPGEVLAIILSLILCCSCATGYRPMHSGYGYSDSWIKPDEFRVTFKANGNTTSQAVSDYALLRAAELCLERGFACFAVVDVTNESSARWYTARDSVYVREFWDPVFPGWSGGSPGGVFATVEQKRIYFRPGTTLLIRGYAVKPERPFTYNAAELAATLKRRYKLNG